MSWPWLLAAIATAQTVWPAYSKIAPISWVIANHVEEGRSKFNFSEANRRQESDEAAGIVNEGEMLPAYYRICTKVLS